MPNIFAWEYTRRTGKSESLLDYFQHLPDFGGVVPGAAGPDGRGRARSPGSRWYCNVRAAPSLADIPGLTPRKVKLPGSPAKSDAAGGEGWAKMPVAERTRAITNRQCFTGPSGESLAVARG